MLTQRRRSHEHAPDDRVAALLAAAAAPTEPGPAPGEEEARAAFRASQPSTVRGPRVRSSLTPLKTAAAAAMGTGLLLTGGIAAAATGSLPGPAQDTARDVLAKVGVSVPGADEHTGGHADGRGSSGTASDGGGSGHSDHAHSSGHGASRGKGKAVRGLAHSGATGEDKGALVSGYASDGHSHAGEHGSHGTRKNQHAQDSSGNARVDAPNGNSRPDGTGQTTGPSLRLPGAAPGGVGSITGGGEGHRLAGTPSGHQQNGH